jgi:hypothetical protein
MLAPMIALATLAAAQAAINDKRDKLTNPDAYAQREDVEQVISNLDRAGVFGSLSPLLNMMTSLRYERSTDTMFTGPYLAAFMGDLNNVTTGLVPTEGYTSLGLFPGKNTDKTDNAEWKAVKSAYELVATPLISLGLSTASNALPGGVGGQVAKMAVGGAMMETTGSGASSRAASAFYDRTHVSQKRRDKDDARAEFEAEGVEPDLLDLPEPDDAEGG